MPNADQQPRPPVPPKPPTPPVPPAPPAPPAAPLPPTPPTPRSRAPEAAPSLRVSLLLPEFGEESHDWRRTWLILALVIVLEIVVIGTAYILVLQRVNKRTAEKKTLTERLAALQTSVKEGETRIAEVAAYSVQLSAAEKALDEHTYWSQVFSILTQRARPGTKFINFIGDSNKATISIDAVAPSYRLAAEQIVEMKADPSVESVRTTAASARVSDTGELLGVTFTMHITLAPESFKRPGAKEAGN